MATIVFTGSTLTVDNTTNLTISSASTVAAGGLLDGKGTINGNFTLLNQGTIAADAPGQSLTIDTGTLTNAGTILANGASLAVGANVVITNLSGSTLTGGTWAAAGTADLILDGGMVVTNNATIILDGTASAFHGHNATANKSVSLEASLTAIGASGALNLLNNRNFLGTDSLVSAGVITLGGGTLYATNGVTIGVGGHLSGFGTVGPLVQNDGLIEANGGTLTLPGPLSISGTGTLQTDAGATLALQTGGSYDEAIINQGTIEILSSVFSSTVSFTGAYQGSGGFLIQGGFDGTARTVLELASGITGNVMFDVDSGGLILDAPGTYSGTLSRFDDNDRIVLAGVTANSAVLQGNVLRLMQNGTTVQSLALNAGSMNYTSATFTVVPNNGNNTSVLTVSGAQAACYREGTRILTDAGEIPIEHLTPGDIVRTHFASLAPIIWIGHRKVDCKHHPEPAKVWPVRVAAHAFGPGLPHTDLFLSPDHAVFVDNVLVPIRYLINDTSITQIKTDTVTYYHVELAEHDVVHAEGLSAETYLENGDRASFDDGGGPIALFPDFGARRWDALGCAPLVLTGRRLDAIRARLAAVEPPRMAA